MNFNTKQQPINCQTLHLTEYKLNKHLFHSFDHISFVAIEKK